MEALAIAVQLALQPSLAHRARAASLPKGITQVLEIAAGDPETLRLAAESTGLTEHQLKDMSGFFVEQVLFDHASDSYRVLGAEKDAPAPVLRQHMALLMKWLHPDATPRGQQSGRGRERGVFVNRVAQAWEDLKSEERRKAYDSNRESVLAGSGRSCFALADTDDVGDRAFVRHKVPSRYRRRNLSRRPAHRRTKRSLLKRIIAHLKRRL